MTRNWISFALATVLTIILSTHVEQGRCQASVNIACPSGCFLVSLPSNIRKRRQIWSCSCPGGGIEVEGGNGGNGGNGAPGGSAVIYRGSRKKRLDNDDIEGNVLNSINYDRIRAIRQSTTNVVGTAGSNGDNGKKGGVTERSVDYALLRNRRQISIGDGGNGGTGGDGGYAQNGRPPAKRSFLISNNDERQVDGIQKKRALFKKYETKAKRQEETITLEPIGGGTGSGAWGPIPSREKRQTVTNSSTVTGGAGGGGGNGGDGGIQLRRSLKDIEETRRKRQSSTSIGDGGSGGNGGNGGPAVNYPSKRSLLKRQTTTTVTGGAGGNGGNGGEGGIQLKRSLLDTVESRKKRQSSTSIGDGGSGGNGGSGGPAVNYSFRRSLGKRETASVVTGGAVEYWAIGDVEIASGGDVESGGTGGISLKKGSTIANMGNKFKRQTNIGNGGDGGSGGNGGYAQNGRPPAKRNSDLSYISERIGNGSNQDTELTKRQISEGNGGTSGPGGTGGASINSSPNAVVTGGAAGSGGSGGSGGRYKRTVLNNLQWFK